jgi:hypothetical protein
VLAENFGAFKLEPVSKSGGLKYSAHGKVDFFGGKKVARSGGAGGLACTILPQAEFFVDFAA